MAVQEIRVNFNVDDSQLKATQEKIALLKREFDLAGQSIDRDKKKLGELREQLAKATGEKEIAKLNKEILSVEKSLLGAEKAAVRLKNELKETGKTESPLSKVNSQISKLGVGVPALGAAIAAGFAIKGIASFASEGVKLAATMEQNRIAFTTFLGSAKMADKVLNDLAKFGAETPFELPELVGAAKKLIAFGVSTDDLMDRMRRLGDISAGTGKPIEEIAVIYGKMLAKGRATMEELNMLVEGGVPIMAELTKATGKQGYELSKFIEAGKVGFPVVQQALDNLTNAGGKFAGLTEKQSQSLNGLLSTLNDNWNALKRTIGEAFVPVLKVAVGWMGKLLGGEASNERTQAVMKEQSAVNTLAYSITGLAEGTKLRAELLQRMNTEYPGFLGNLKAEKVSNDEILDRLKEVNNEYRKKVILVANEEKMTAAIKAQSKLYEDVQKSYANSIDVVALAQDNLFQTIDRSLPIERQLMEARKLLTKEIERTREPLKEMSEELQNQSGSFAKGTPQMQMMAARIGELNNALVAVNQAYNNGTKSSLEFEKGQRALSKEQIQLEALMKEFGVESSSAFDLTKKKGVESLQAVSENAKTLAEGSLALLKKNLSDLQTQISQTPSDSGTIPTLLRQSIVLENQIKEIEAQMKLLSEGPGAIAPIEVPFTPSFGGADPMDAIEAEIAGAELEVPVKMKMSDEDKQAFLQGAVQLTQLVADTIFTLEQEAITRRKEADLAALDERYSMEMRMAGENVAAKTKAEKKYQAEKLKIEKEAFEKQKQLAIAQAVINGALAVTNALATLPYPANLIAIALAVATTAAEIAVISSQSFAKGGIDIQGAGTETSDSIPARLSKGESVMTAKETKTWKPLLKAIRRGDVIPGATGMPILKHGEIMEAMYGVSASLDDKRIIRELRNQTTTLKEVLENSNISRPNHQSTFSRNY